MEIEQTESGEVELWTPKEVRDAFDWDEIVLIDVRTPQEYSLERIKGALLAPMHLPGQSEKRIVLHCGSAVRSGKVAQQCLQSGIEKIAHMKGGFGAWKEAGLDYIGTDVSSGAPKMMNSKAT